jgi:hypothetical protein
MSWADAAAMAGPVIDATFAEPEEIVYTSAKYGVFIFPAIKIDEPAEQFQGEGRNLRKITWELPQGDIPGDASNRDHFTHAGRRWKVLEAERRDDIGKWWVVVQDEGPA